MRPYLVCADPCYLCKKRIWVFFHLCLIQRLSNLRIHENFNCHLCLRVVEACVRAGAIDYGMFIFFYLLLLFYNDSKLINKFSGWHAPTLVSSSNVMSLYKQQQRLRHLMVLFWYIRKIHILAPMPSQKFYKQEAT